jgi:hypothetical protein
MMRIVRENPSSAKNRDSKAVAMSNSASPMSRMSGFKRGPQSTV